MREFPDTEKGNKESLKYLNSLKAMQDKHSAWATTEGRDLIRSKKDNEGSLTPHRIESLKNARQRFRDKVLVKPEHLSVVSEVVTVEAEAPTLVVKKAAAKKPTGVEAECHEALGVLLQRGRPLDTLRALQALADPAVAKELDLVIDLNEMLK